MLNTKILKSSSYNLLILSGIIWGLTPVIYKNTLLFTGAVSLMVVNFLFGAAVMYIFNYKKFEKLSNNQKHYVMLFGLFTVGSLLLYLFGLNQTTALHASIISMTLPFWVYLIIAIFLREKVHKSVILGSTLATAGLSIIILTTASGSENEATLIGDFMLLMSNIFTAIAITAAKKVLQLNNKISAEQIVYYKYLIAGLIALAILAFYSGGFQFTLNFVSLAWLLVSITLAGFVPVIIFYKAVKNLPGERIGDGNFISPVVGVLAAWIFLGEQITIPFFIGSAIIFIGLMYSNNKIKPIHWGHFIHNESSLLERIKRFEKEVVKDAKDFEKKVVSAAKSNL